jgi:beta-ribofuranosylaminobenzene 5'-phosphate synthase
MYVRILARPRIHIGLVDLGMASLRSYGGLGFAVNGIPTIWRVEHARSTVLCGLERLDQRAQTELSSLAKRVADRCRSNGFCATLEQVADQHVGLGTKTSLSLALISAVDVLNGLGMSTSEILTLSNRGGASGAGVNLFSCGGIVWDGGHRATREQVFLPSGSQEPIEPPPVLGRWEFPHAWRIALMLPRGKLANGEYEREFFRKNTPLPKAEVLETMAIMYHGVIPAFVTHDATTLRSALVELHRIGFKHREVAAQSEETRAALTRLQLESDLPVGMSSMGPMIYAILPADDPTADCYTRRFSRDNNIRFLGIFEGYNKPHEIQES